MRLVFLLVPIACGFMASLNLFEKDFFSFFLWSFVATALFLAILPIVFDTDKKVVPVYHIFVTLLLFFIFLTAISYFDISKAKLPNAYSIVYSVVAGVVLTAVTVALRPKG